MYHDVDFACSLHNLTNPRERILKNTSLSPVLSKLNELKGIEPCLT